MPRSRGKGDASLRAAIRGTREPFASFVDAVGLAAAISRLVRSARQHIEASPREAGIIEAAGVREEGTIWFVGESASRLFDDLGHDLRDRPNRKAALIPARVFTIVAYRHPFFDGNKRTAFLSACLVGDALGFEIRAAPYRKLEDEVRDLTVREAAEHQVAEWFLDKVFMLSSLEEE